jgi:hypothetical protein
VSTVIQAKLRALYLASVLSVSGCGGAPTPPPMPLPRPDAAAPAAASTGRILFECTPPDADIVVDGTSRGTAADLARAGGLAIAFGLHRFEIARTGFRAFRIELKVGEKPERLRVQLKPIAAAP